MSYNSTILNKKKQLGCGCFDYNFSKNRCKMHATIEDTEKRAAKYAAQPIVRKAGLFDVDSTSSLPTSFLPPKWMENEANDVVSILKPFECKNELGRWFMDRKIEMTGKCMHCGGETMILNKESDSKFHYSVCHILPKNLFPSISTHHLNWIELCYYGKSCHKNFDDHQIDIVDLNCFGIVIDRIVKIYPSIAKEERRRIPSVLMQYIETEI